VIQGLGYALYEAREVDPHTGDILSGGWKIIASRDSDTPLIDVHFDEAGFDHVLGGSVGIGEVGRCRPRRRWPTRSATPPVSG